MQECEALEVCVIGDKTTDFNWDSFDDDAMLTRLYILTEDKLQLTDDHWIVQMVDNNYSPTFDAFYVRPSLLDKLLPPAGQNDIPSWGLLSFSNEKSSGGCSAGNSRPVWVACL